MFTFLMPIKECSFSWCQSKRHHEEPNWDRGCWGFLRYPVTTWWVGFQEGSKHPIPEAMGDLPVNISSKNSLRFKSHCIPRQQWWWGVILQLYEFLGLCCFSVMALWIMASDKSPDLPRPHISIKHDTMILRILSAVAFCGSEFFPHRKPTYALIRS